MTPIVRSGRRRSELREHLVLRLLADRAGVEQDQVGFLRAIGQLIALLLEQARHALRVVLVHLAAVGDQVELGHHRIKGGLDGAGGFFCINGRDLR